jgi:DNA-binding response OmpR family regulator
VLGLDAKTQQQIGALTQRLMIVAGQAASAKLVSNVLREIGPCQFLAAPDAERAMLAADAANPLLIIIEHGDGVDGVALTRELRRSDFRCRMAPIILLSGEATAQLIVGARDAGAHEFLRKPFTIKDLVRRLEAVALKPRAWVEGIAYVGPDRRRFNSGDYDGPRKRRLDHAVTPDEGRLAQSLRILKAALAAIEEDPRQALRALKAQAEYIATSPKAKADTDMRADAVGLGHALALITPPELRRQAIAPLVEPLIALLPADTDARRRPAA